MRTRYTVMAVLLRTTAAPAWVSPAARVVRTAGLTSTTVNRTMFSGDSRSRMSTASGLRGCSSNGRGNNDKKRSSLSHTSLSQSETAQDVSKVLESREGVAAIATDTAAPGGHERRLSREAGAATADPIGEHRVGEERADVVQPLLRKHMKELEARGRTTVKARQHVNPLAKAFQQPVELPEAWFPAAFRKPDAPLLVDIGCAKGTFLLNMAKADPDRNFLGLEIRRPIAAVALSRATEIPTRNCHMVCCNVNVDLDALLTEAARCGAAIDTICIQFPDPHFKARNYKRRVLQPKLVKCIEKHLRPGGTFFMQSDVLEVLEDMRTITRESAEVLEDQRSDLNDWMEGPEQNPFGVPTERERVTYEKESPEENRVYRCVFTKKGGST